MDFGVASGERMERRASYVDHGPRAALVACRAFFSWVTGCGKPRTETAMVHDLTRPDIDKLAKIQDTYKLVGYVLQNFYLTDYVHLAHT